MPGSFLAQVRAGTGDAVCVDQGGVEAAVQVAVAVGSLLLAFGSSRHRSQLVEQADRDVREPSGQGISIMAGCLYVRALQRRVGPVTVLLDHPDRSIDEIDEIVLGVDDDRSRPTGPG